MTIPITPEKSEGFWPGRLWSLWEMINFKIGPTHRILGEVGLLLHLASFNEDRDANKLGGQKTWRTPEQQKIFEETKKNVLDVADMVEKGLGYLKCPHIASATASLRRWTTHVNPAWGDLRWTAIMVRDAIQTELDQHFYYQYPKQNAQLLRSVLDDWKAAVTAFPNAERDALLATDCYALGHHVASVFHSMRVLEFGLKATAADVGLTFDIQQWHNIIEQVESQIATQRKALPKGAPRNERLQFLSEAAKEFFYFKEGWRNHVSHNRAEYDEHQALSVLTHTRSFMNHLASKLSETPPA